MERHELEKRLKRMRRVPCPESLDQRMSSLFGETGRETLRDDPESRLTALPRVPVPETLDRRMERLFDTAGEAAPVRRPWRMPVWAAASIGLVLVASFLIRGGLGPEPVVVEIVLDHRTEQFLLGGEPKTEQNDLALFSQGDCTVETVWPADAPDLDRHPINDSRSNGEPG